MSIINMSNVVCIGAINKITGEYVYPKIANKKDKYICTECNRDLILCQGEVRVHHFRHKAESVTPCYNYSKPTESQIHKDAKLLLKKLLERKIPISFIRHCASCEKNDKFEIPEVSETSTIKIEYRFEYNGAKIADVAYLDNDEIVSIFEICNTHKTCSGSRPEPWFEIDARTLIQIANDNQFGSSMQLPCIRCEKCDECIEKSKIQIMKYRYISNPKQRYYDIDKYVRIKLGQTIFPTPEPKECELKKPLCINGWNCYDFDDCMECNECKYNEWYDKVWRIEGHLKIDFDARDKYEDNKKIIELFENDFGSNIIVIHTWKGGVEIFLVSKIIFRISKYTKNDFWDMLSMNKSIPSHLKSYVTEIDRTGYGTVEIIKECIRYSK